MKKLEPIQYRKTISAYGGSGSIIETMDNGSLLVKKYDVWPCFGQNERRNRRTLENPRLLQAIRQSFPNVAELLEIPQKDLDNRQQYFANQRDCYDTICADWFPKWFYCPKCRQMHKLDDWRGLWEEKFPNDNRFGVNFPACPFCSNQIGDNKYYRKRLEQIRFVMASLDSGEIEDIPFDKLFDLNRDERVWVIDNDGQSRTDLSYHTGTSGDGLQSISIKSAEGGYINFSSIYNHYLVKNGHAFRVVLRNATNTYFPNILSCLFIPQPDNGVILKVRDDEAHNYTKNEIANRYLLSLQQVSDILNGVYDGNGNAVDLKMAEFNFITNPNIYDERNKRSESDFFAIRYPQLSELRFIKCVYALPLIKETSVLMSFSRISSGRDKIWHNVQSNNVELMNPRSVIPFGCTHDNVEFMPAIEGFGEGLFFEFNADSIREGDRLIFIHTYCHLIMKELEFTCGYPVTSLKERLYQRDDRLGFLIYTIAGSEGSYGGLVSLLPDETNATEARLVDLVNIAIQRAKDCPNDPICLNDENHRGHCFACVDLPETSCEEFNNYLDRNVFLRYMFPHA